MATGITGAIGLINMITVMGVMHGGRRTDTLAERIVTVGWPTVGGVMATDVRPLPSGTNRTRTETGIGTGPVTGTETGIDASNFF